eukprot:TRINITY_DN13353_c0_g1_i1.p1 TRINITY_DN13353_c0_g1~~TRINITY_DN13353_c0_g1_i1.p1  ORF type:complete len:1092 (+),score=143.71 TRINITY_DN13353_c0_g1_i1:256-3531(+)
MTLVNATLFVVISKAVSLVYGDMTAIAESNYSGVEFPDLSAVALEKISQCLTAYPYCDPDNLYGEKDVRKTYGTVIGTEEIQTYLFRLGTDELMAAVEKHSTGCQGICFAETVTQLKNEATMILSVAGWFNTYGLFFNEIDANLDLAFSSALALVEMPSQAPMKVKKKDILHIILTVVELVGDFLVVASGAGEVLAPELFAAEAEVDMGAKAADEGTQEIVKETDTSVKTADNAVEETDSAAQEPADNQHGQPESHDEADDDDSDDDDDGSEAKQGDEAKKGNEAKNNNEHHADDRESINEKKEKFENSCKAGHLVGESMAFLASTIEESLECREEHCFKRDNGEPETSSDEGRRMSSASDQDDASLVRYDTVITWLKESLSGLMAAIAAQEAAIASNWKKLKRAASLATACKVHPLMVAAMIMNAFPAMQWVALGVLMRPKYAIFWQRDYGHGGDNDGPACYYDGTSDSTTTGCQNTGSAAGCYSPDAQIGLDSSVYYGQTQETGGGNSDCAGSGNVYTQDGKAGCFNKDTSHCSAQRYIWVGEIGAPSNTPPAEFWDALMNTKTGPIPKFVNKVFGKEYTKGWQPFVEQCSYMPKVFTPPLSSGQIDYSNWGQSPSSTSVPCSVFGMLLETFAFPDCNTLKKISGSGLSGQCINGAGSNHNRRRKSAFFTGNFNQQVYIPKRKHHYSSLHQGTVGCCLPWQSDLPTGCDQIICDCFSVIEASVFGWISDTQLNNWAPECSTYTQTDVFNNNEFLKTSLGAGWSWSNVLASGASGGWAEETSPGSIATTCACTSPGESSPNNGYSCSDGFTASCSSEQVCVSSDSWPKTDVPCADPESVTCTCNSPNQGSPENGYTCSFGSSTYSAYCSSGAACTSSSPFLQSDPPCSTVCSCDTPNEGSPNNGFTCTDSSLNAYCNADLVCTTATPWLQSGPEPCASPEGNTCKCLQPNEGSPNNGYACANGARAYCEPTQTCYSSASWLQSDPPCAVTCTCSNPNQVSPNNGYSCSDGTSAYCQPAQVCTQASSIHWLQSDVPCAVPDSVTCTCDSPNEGTPNNGYSCSDGFKAWCQSDQVCTSSSSFSQSDLPCAAS